MKQSEFYYNPPRALLRSRGVRIIDKEKKRRKRDSVSTVITLGAVSPLRSSDLTRGPSTGRTWNFRPAPLFDLAPAGVYQARELPPCW